MRVGALSEDIGCTPMKLPLPAEDILCPPITVLEVSGKSSKVPIKKEPLGSYTISMH